MHFELSIMALNLKKLRPWSNMQDLAFIMILLKNSPRQIGLLALHWPFKHVTVPDPSNAYFF